MVELAVQEALMVVYVVQLEVGEELHEVQLVVEEDAV